MKFGAIYKFVCRDKSVKDEYIGSTKNLHQRIVVHKDRCNNINNPNYILPIYMFINVNGGWDNWEIVVIKKLPICSKDARCYIEQFYINLYKPTLNTINAVVDPEYDKNYDANRPNKVERAEKFKIHYKKNKDIYNANRRVKVKCPNCDKEMNKCNITRHIKTQH